MHSDLHLQQQSIVYIVSIAPIIVKGDTCNMKNKAKGQPIKADLKIKSFAQLEEEVQKHLKAELEDKPLESLIDKNEFCGWSPAHTINGVPYEELMEQKKKQQDENS